MLRASKNWSQLKASKAIGVSVDTWGNWERKRSFPDVPHIKKIQEVFGVTYDDIIFL
jgi:transcriptional regulator with XRE-family HTH domain